MKHRLQAFGSEWVARRGAVDALFDLWQLTVVIAVIVGFAIGYASHP